MLKNRKVKWFIFILLVCALTSPMVLIEVVYRKSLASIQKPFPTPSAPQYSKHIQEAFWFGHGEKGEVKVIPEMPWNILFSICLDISDPQKHQTFLPHGSKVTTMAARQLMLGYQAKGQLNWELAWTAMTIWLSRNWTTGDILNSLADKCYFGRGAYGIKEAAKTYYKKTPDELSDDELANLIALEFAPGIFLKDPEALKSRKDKILALIASRGTGTEK